VAHNEYYTPEKALTPRIESGVPIPKAKRHDGTQVRGEMRKLITSLKKGQCLLWPMTAGEDTKTLRSKIRACASNVRREFPDRTYVVRTTPPDGIRIWRIL
jgi:hypothetical protein